MRGSLIGAMVLTLIGWTLATAQAAQTQTPPQAPPAAAGRGAAASKGGASHQTAPARGAAAKKVAPQPVAGRGGAVLVAQMERERRIRESVAKIVRKTLGLNDEQMARLGAIDSGFADQRARIDVSERNNRLRLRQLMQSPNPNKDSIGMLSDRIQFQFPQRRLTLDKQERDSLAKLLDGKQRAQFINIRDQVRWLMDSTTAAAAAAAAADTPKANPAGRRGGGPAVVS
jgi:hypothetical protein